MNLSSQISISRSVSFLDKLLFTKHLGVMVKSGIPISEAIATIRDQTPNPTFRKVLTSVLSDIDNGQSLETAFSRKKNFFDPLYLNLIQVGEQSGTLTKSLDYLAQQMKSEYEFKKKVQGALMYPAIVLSASGIIGLGLSIFVLPNLTTLFQSLNAKLPLSTQILLGFANIMKNYGVFVVAGIIGFFVFLRYFLRSSGVKPIWHRLLLSLPTLGIFFQDGQLASLTRNLGIMLKSGLPILASLQTQHDATENVVYRRYLEKIIQGVEKGKTISEVLTEGRFAFVPLIVTKMISVGEKTGSLDEMFLYLGDFFEDEVDNFAKNLPTLIEPIILILIGLVVGFVALAIISPIYQLTGSIHQ